MRSTLAHLKCRTTRTDLKKSFAPLLQCQDSKQRNDGFVTNDYIVPGVVLYALQISTILDCNTNLILMLGSL